VTEGWTRLSAGDGAKGPRWYDWLWLPLAAPWQPDWRRGLLVRRHLSEPTELTAYVGFAPHATPLATVVQVAGSRWTIEQCFDEAKGAVGLDHYEGRSWTGWYRHITLALWAYALLTVLRAVHLPTDAAPKKTLAQPAPSSLAAFKAARGLYHCVSMRCDASCGTSCWPHSSAWNAFWPGRRGAAGIKALPNIGTISDAQFHNYNCSTKR
jgi:hypothetical protein